MSDWKEIKEVAYTKKTTTQLPLFSPWFWRWALMIAFFMGILLGGGIAIYTLHIRGLL